MADIRVRITGKTFFQVDNTLASILTEAFPEHIEYVRVVRPAPIPTAWTYEVAKLPTPTGLHAIRRTKGAQVEILPTGDPKEAKKLWPETPAEVIATFAAVPARERVGGPAR